MRFSLIFLSLTWICPGQQPPAASPSGKPAAQTAQNPSDVAAKQNGSIGAMQSSVDKQKATVRVQVGEGGTADSFFTTAWTSPPSIVPPSMVPPCDAIAESDLKPMIAEAAKAQDVQPELVSAVVRRESASYPCAMSDKGAMGLMQLMPEVAQQFGVDPLDPKANLDAGTRYLKQLLTRYNGDMRLALAAYNAGPQRVDAEKKVPAIPETTAYVDAILKDLNANSTAPK